MKNTNIKPIKKYFYKTISLVLVFATLLSVGSMFSFAVSPNHVHKWDEGYLISGTCTVDEVTQYTCQLCGEKKTEVVPAPGHDWTDFQVIQPAKCESQGIIYRKCRRCPCDKTRLTDMLGHNFVFDKIENEPTCETCEVHLYRCTRCNETSRKILDALNHNFVKIVIPPKAYSLGFTMRYCTMCKGKFDVKSKPPTGKVPGIKCVTKTASAEKITWNKVPTASGYQIQISNAKGNAWKTIKTLNTNKNVYVFKKLSSASAYKFRVRFFIRDTYHLERYSPWSKAIISPTPPKATKLPSATGANKALTAKWSKVAGVNGYQLQYATNAKFTGAKLKAIKGATNNSLKVASLKPGAKYYVRVRTFKTVNAKHYYSGWSNNKIVIIK